MAVPLSQMKLAVSGSTTPVSAFRPLSASKSHPSLTSLVNSPSNRSLITAATAPTVILSPTSASISSSSSSLVPPISITPIRKQAAELCTLGIRSFQRLDFWTAISQYTMALELVADDFRTWNNRGIAYSAAKLYRMGIYDYNEAIRLAPKCADFYYQRGVAWSALRDFPTAIKDYTECLKLKSDHADAYNNRGNAHRNLQKFDLAQLDLEAAVALVPTNTLYSKNLSRVVAEKEKIAEQEKAQEKSRIAEVELLLQSVINAKLNGNTTLMKSEVNVDSPNPSSESMIQELVRKKDENSAVGGTSLSIMSNLSSLPTEFVSQLINILKEVQNTSTSKAHTKIVRKSPDDSSGSDEDDASEIVPTKRARSNQPQSSSTSSLISLTSFSSDTSESCLSPNSAEDDSSDELPEPYSNEANEMDTDSKQIPDLKFAAPTILKKVSS